MTTAADTVSRAAVRPGSKYDRLFYGAMAVALGLTVLAGFAPSYYLRFMDGGPVATFSGGPFTRLIHLHGALFTAWMVLFVVQTALVASRRVAVHRRLGIAGAVLAAGMIVAGTLTAIAGVARGSTTEGMTPLEFLAIPFFDMVLFAIFITLALVRRRDREAHKRLMLLAYVSIVTAAIARLPGMLALGPPAFFGLSLLFVIAGVIYDAVTRGRVHRVYLWGGALLLLSVPARLAISSTAAWRALAEALTR